MMWILFLFVISFVSGNRVIQTNNGPIAGIFIEKKNVEAFLGIPYAEPPVGNLRFARPAPKSPWTETLEANAYSPACIQGLFELNAKFFNHTGTMDEDCLYLNIWVPKTEGNKKTIMVFIHGGGFMGGTANLEMYNGASLSQHGDVIVASMNYRVGTLGFFSGFIDEAAGSMGIYDQLLAIQWIKDNAQHFGGDPDNIVLFGESAGAFSIGLHMVSPLSKNLFKRAILESGSGISPMFSDDNKVLRIGCQKVSTLVGCATSKEELKENPKRVVECMKTLPPEKIAEADGELFKTFQMLVPRVGDEFLPKNPADLFREGESKGTEVLLGVNRDEGTMFVSFAEGFKNDEIFSQKFDANSLNETSAVELLKSFDANSINETSAIEIIKSLTYMEHDDKIIQDYLKRVGKESRYTYLNAASDIIGDSLITCGTVFQADFQSLKKKPVYFYLFDYRSPSSNFPEWVGVPHFDEVQYVFGNPHLKTFSEYEKELSKDMMDMWVAFANSGNPSIPGGLKWPKYTYEDPKYLIISRRDRVGVKPDNNRCEIWRHMYRSTIDEEVVQNLKS